MYQKKSSKGHKIGGIILVIYGGLSMISVFLSMISLIKTAASGSGTTSSMIMGMFVSLFIGLPALIIGIHLLRRADWSTDWRSNDPSQAKRLMRKLNKIHDDARLMEIGRTAALDDVSLAAFAKVKNKKLLSEYVQRNQGNTSRLSQTLSCITDDNELADIAKSSLASLPLSIRKQAVGQIQDPGILGKIAEDRSFSTEVRAYAYERLGRAGDGDLLLARDASLTDDVRAEAYARLQSAGLDGDRKLAEDQTMPPHLRGEAYQRLGEGEKASEMQRKVDVVQLMDSKLASDKRREAAGRILDTSEEKWIGEVLKSVVTFDNKGDYVIQDFLVSVAELYPARLRNMWPKIRRWAHTDSTKHLDGHSDHSHYDYTPSYGGAHHDGHNSSDCTHSDMQNREVHTDLTGENLLNRFPPSIKE